MLKSFGLLTVVFFISFLNSSYCQSDKDKASTLCDKAIPLIDNGKYDEAIKLLEEASDLDPESIAYPFEIGYAYYLKNDFKSSLTVYKKIVKMKGVTDQCFQMLGNAYDMLGDTANAFKSYDAGLKVFPNSGRLFLEKGNCYYNRELYLKALPFYEEGIKMNPGFPSNYFKAAKIYCNSNDKIWGLLYAEIFMNLERNSKRTEEISKLLYKTFSSSFEKNNDTSFSVKFGGDVIDINKIRQSKFKMSYEIAMTIAFTSVIKQITNSYLSLSLIDTIRKNFLTVWNQKEMNNEFNNILFDYFNKLYETGNFEAYNYWIFMQGNKNEFEKWKNDNAEKSDNFFNWFSKNQLKLDNKNNFHREQY